jgi:hypothetical protein
MASSSSPRHSNKITADALAAALGHEQRLAECERRLTAHDKLLGDLAARLAEPAAARPEDDGWERMILYAERRGISVRTVDRRVKAKKLEKWKPDGSNTVYVREVAGPPPRRRGHRPAPIAAADDGVPMSATPGASKWPWCP